MLVENGSHEAGAGAGTAVPTTPRYWSYSSDHTIDGEALDASRPAYSFTCLIGLAVLNAGPAGELSVRQIYDYIQRNFPFFQTAKGTWRNSVRHVLSLNKYFERRAASSSSSSSNGSGSGGASPLLECAADEPTTAGTSTAAAAVVRGTGGKSGLWTIKPGMQLSLLEHIAEGQVDIPAATARHLGIPDLPNRHTTKKAASATASAPAGKKAASSSPAVMITSIPTPPAMASTSTSAGSSKRPAPQPLLLNTKQETPMPGASYRLPTTSENGAKTPTRPSKTETASLKPTASSPAKLSRRTSAGKVKQKTKGKRRTSSSSSSSSINTDSSAPAAAGVSNAARKLASNPNGKGKGKHKIKAEPCWAGPHDSYAVKTAMHLESSRSGQTQTYISMNADGAINDVDMSRRGSMAATDHTLNENRQRRMMKQLQHHHRQQGAAEMGQKYEIPSRWLFPVAGCETEEEEGVHPQLQLGDIINDVRPLSTVSGGGGAAHEYGVCNVSSPDAFLSPYDMSGMQLYTDTAVGSDLTAPEAPTIANSNGGWAASVGVA